MEACLKASRAVDGVSVLIDLSECEFIDSSGFALIVGAWRDLENRAGGERLVMCCAADQVKRLLKITGADEEIPIHASVDEALADLRGQSEAVRSV
jgi:anti-anti-sigma factor